MTRQAIQLGWLPRLQITRVRERLRADLCRRHQLAAMIVTGLSDVVLRQGSDNLAAAYGNPLFPRPC